MTRPPTKNNQQADYYDHRVADPEFEINRPHGESRFYQYLMNFKFHSVASVVAVDISFGCLERARVRAHRYGVKYELVMGDAENLPFGDGTFYYGFVHDGLHHLSNPERALIELARVASRGVMVTEPDRANLTNLLVG